MIELSTIVRFLMQLGLALAGATSLWAVFLHYLRQKTSDESKAKNLERLTSFLIPLFSSGLFLFILSRLILKEFFYATASLAHEGIVVKATIDYIKEGLEAVSVLVYLLILISAVLLYIFRFRKDLFNRYAIFLFSANFLIISLIDVFILYTNSFDKLQLFYFLHHWHSIFTLGTVICVDYFYLRTIPNVNLKRTIYPMFPFFSVVIWSGLGLDFLSNILIFKQGFIVNTQFLFIQTVIAIIIINGALLSSRINTRLLESVNPNNPRPLKRREELTFGLSGSVSIISWLTIAFIDLFVFDLKYWQFLTFYFAAISVAFLTDHVLTKIRILTYKP